MTENSRPGLFARLRQGLARTRERLGGGIADLLLGRRAIDALTVEEIETLLLSADAGVEATATLVDDLNARLARHELADGAAVLEALKERMVALLAPCEVPAPAFTAKPHVILMVGVNGAGKTTTIGKLARRLTDDGKQVVLAAGDTFRAAAVEQLKVWGERLGVPVIAQQPGADPAAVIFDALQAAKTRGADVVIADTSGRLHTQAGLMDELRKIRRVMGRFDPSAPHETLLVLDAGNGQNALIQARQFNQAIGVTGLVLTKLDGTAKGGVVLAIASQLRLPIRYLGVGEKADDLRPFVAREFVEALLSRDETAEAP
ncbi:MAG: signal recognition particle-docking protein FtsY [Immundisolibacter sp.]|nr:signal recognition particle-docking protein FtsY [Immundisolibacter sp.]MDD3652270.1 signal recognition particle-docking protein FtsY [Immundisolibacter sp.]